jgi:hypothetical protein
LIGSVSSPGRRRLRYSSRRGQSLTTTGDARCLLQRKLQALQRIERRRLANSTILLSRGRVDEFFVLSQRVLSTGTSRGVLWCPECIINSIHVLGDNEKNYVGISWIWREVRAITKSVRPGWGPPGDRDTTPQK